MDRDEIETLRQARLLEEEKAQYSVSRRLHLCGVVIVVKPFSVIANLALLYSM